MATIDAQRRPYLLAHMTRNVASASIPAVLWKNIKTGGGASDTDDPAGTISTDTNCVVLHNPDALPWLCAFPLISGNGVPTVALTANFFGFFPFDPGSIDAQYRQLPSDADSTNFDDSVLGSSKNLTKNDGSTTVIPGLWIPLRELNTATATTVTFDSTTTVDKDSTSGSTKQQRVLTPRYIYTQGARQIVALPVAVLDVVTAACLVGILHS